jgi:ATP-dependent Clp protease ATP-binding subunit ClpA
MVDKLQPGARRARPRFLHSLEPSVRIAVLDARHEAARAGTDRIRGEHMLLGVFAAPGPAADALTAAGLELADLRQRIARGIGVTSAELDAEALSSLGIDLDAVRRATDAAFGPGALDRVRPAGRRSRHFAPDAKQALSRASREMDRLGQRQISTGHLLLGLIDEPGGARDTLVSAGADIAALRADMLRRIGPAV